MNAALANIRYYEELSQETLCYTADLMVDNLKMGVLRNSGNGEADSFDPVDGQTMQPLKNLQAEIETLPYRCPITGDHTTMGLHIWVGQQIEISQ